MNGNFKRRMLALFFVFGLNLFNAPVFAAAPATGAPAKGAPAAGPVLRILTYNIHHGAGMDGKIDLQRTARVIQAARPDLVALQEVDRQSRRAGGVDQAAKLGELTGMNVAFGRAMDFDGGQYGVALLSKFPIGQTRTYALPTDQGFEPRALLEAQIEPPAGGAKITFLVTHLDQYRNPRQRERQAARILALTSATTGAPRILAGDLNARPDDPALLALLKQWTDPVTETPFFTCPADAPAERIDYVLFRPALRFRLAEARVLDERMASDHRPVLTALELTGNHGQ